MSKHTELPWRLSKYHYPHSEIVADRGTLDNDAFPHSRLICRISDNCKSPEEYKANAEYIVQAVNSHKDLLAACKKLANIAEVVGHCVGDWTPAHQALAQQYAAEGRDAIAKAAIKEAKGE